MTNDLLFSGRRELLEGGKRLRAINTEEVGNPAGGEALYEQRVASEKAEGLVVRADGRTFTVKPVMHIDCVVGGYTLRGEDPTLLRSVLVGRMREAGQVQIIGSCGNLGTDDYRRALRERVTQLDREAAHHHASNDGTNYQFVRPESVFEIKVNDLQAEGSNGEPVPRMVIGYTEEGATTPCGRCRGARCSAPFCLGCAKRGTPMCATLA